MSTVWPLDYLDPDTADAAPYGPELAAYDEQHAVTIEKVRTGGSLRELWQVAANVLSWKGDDRQLEKIGGLLIAYGRVLGINAQTPRPKTQQP